jgi:dipeptidyl aminopeptidase/acylaminoacyl peptidase
MRHPEPGTPSERGGSKIADRRLLPLVALTVLLGAGLSSAEGVGAQATQPLMEPLPLELVAQAQGVNTRAPIHLSPDGEWVAFTVATQDRVAWDPATRSYTPTGVPLSDGDARMEARIAHARTGEVHTLGGGRGSSWSPTWSPDGSRLAFYSDQDGEAGLWVWEWATRRATRITEEIVRPVFGFEGPRWASDGERLLVKLLPEGLSLAQANAMDPTGEAGQTFPEVAPDEPSVRVQRAGMGREGGATSMAGLFADFLTFRSADLAIIDLPSGQARRISRGVPVASYAWAPDDGAVAYTVVSLPLPNTQQITYELRVHEMETDVTRLRVENTLQTYGVEWSWSPDGEFLAYISSGPSGTGEVVLLSTRDGESRIMGEGDAPSFNRANGEFPPIWAPDGSRVYAVGGGQLWGFSPGTGEGTLIAEIPDWTITALARPPDRATASIAPGGGTLWVMALASGGRSGIHSVDVETGRTRLVVEESKSYPAPAFAFTGTPDATVLALVSTDLQNLEDVWVLRVEEGSFTRATDLNQGFDGYHLGSARLVEWEGPEGRPLRGALLLPPDYEPREPLPLVVWVYGGVMGSNSVNQFGLRFGAYPVFNWHVLATRGYAVLVPDAPLRVGRVAEDLMATVMPGVDAVIEMGYADPNRLAVMGQSYGAINTLSMISQTDRFRAAVITAAVSHPDLFADYLRNPGFYEGGQGRMGGSIWEHHERYFENSPLFRFDGIQTPLLIGHGEFDGDLITVEATFTALERLGKRVEYRLYEGEGHVITQPRHVIDFWERRLEFLAEHLKLGLDERGRVMASGAH